MKNIFLKIPKTALSYVLLYALLYLSFGGILYLCNMTYLLWFKLFSFGLIVLGSIIATIQYQKSKIISRVLLVSMELILSILLLFGYLVFVDTEEIVDHNGQRMVKVSHSFLLSNWIEYYDYSNIIVRSSQPRIHEMYDDSLHDSQYLYTIFYDKDGNKVNND